MKQKEICYDKLNCERRDCEECTFVKWIDIAVEIATIILDDIKTSCPEYYSTMVGER